jgi:hypothetical protein
MRSIVLCVFTFAFLLAASPTFAAERPDLDWSQLIDQSVQVYDDPYRELEPGQLISLVTVARLRQQAERGQEVDQARLDQETESLVAAGIDIDDLIAQRWEVAKRRERAATSGNPAVDGREIELAGFVIPAPPDDDGFPTAYLVPERGMCSHMPPPPPNQMVRLRLFGGWQPQAIYEPVRLSGELGIAPSSRTIRVVDGLVPMRATFSMEVSDIETWVAPLAQATTPGIPTNASPALGER